MSADKTTYLCNINKLTHDNGFHITNYYYDNEDGKQKIGRWRWFNGNVTSTEDIDYRSILYNELVFDIDSYKWKDEVLPLTKSLQQICDKNGIPYFTCYTGGKGTHTHIFFRFQKHDQTIELLRKAEKIGLKNSEIRMYFWNLILNWMGAKKDKHTRGELFDSRVVKWNDNNKGHLIRAIGGRKITNKDHTDSIIKYKTVTTELKERKDDLDKPELVRYPEKIESWVIPSNLVNKFLFDWIKSKEEYLSKNPPLYQNIKLKGRYT
jgi:hypothetical protein